ncbi:hypothetical protein AB0953_16650 [Streptomyces sp. NPDC046866]|uniref:hypothetical protein n=1 Tax=Streptomyces sp. NPDC046866 TaxID=3154921 RepID=UPI003454C6C7
MTKHLIARTTAVAVSAIAAAGISAGAYYDEAGGWPAVAALWMGLAILVAISVALAWAFSNWNAH